MWEKLRNLLSSILPFIKTWWQKFISWRKYRYERFKHLPWYRKIGNMALTFCWMFLLFLFLVDINFLWLFGKSGNNTYYSHSSAVLEILHDLGGPWKPFYIFKLIPAFVRDYLYRSVSKSRYKIFGRNNSCLSPKKNVKKSALNN